MVIDESQSEDLSYAYDQTNNFEGIAQTLVKPMSKRPGILVKCETTQFSPLWGKCIGMRKIDVNPRWTDARLPLHKKSCVP